LNPGLLQCNVSAWNYNRTLHGMHHQTASHKETKLVRSTRGAIFDVVLDLRPASSTSQRCISAQLSEDDGLITCVSEGCAHGFQTLSDDTEVAFHISESFQPECARGVRWDDPTFSIQWPACGRRLISDRDAIYPNFAC
jgi:dTDP-4-dehydrorhamnose 3,5-epimerase